MVTKKKKNNQTLLELKDIKYDLLNLTGDKIAILEKLNLKIQNNKILGIVGKSGCGKSTLLKIIAGLISPSGGSVKYYSAEPPKISIVFEDFALFPWLNVEENIALGLKSEFVSEKESTIRVKEIIDLTGLEGYEAAYPKELSAGMKQRVSFARALISEPDILLMDAPFASLDTLTTETLIDDLLELWSKKMINIKSIVLVSQNINDIVDMCSDVVIVKDRPCKIFSQFHVNLPLPRSESTPEYKNILDKIYEGLGTKSVTSSDNIYKRYINIIGVTAPAFIGLLEILLSKKHKGEAEMSKLSNDSGIDKLLPILELARMLRFAKFDDDKVNITAFGRAFVNANKHNQKLILGSHLLKYVDIMQEIQEHYPKKMKELEKTLKKQVTPEEAKKILDTLFALAQYADLL
jgi:NitT/TauT family transport system ATP-binding protein